MMDKEVSHHKILMKCLFGDGIEDERDHLEKNKVYRYVMSVIDDVRASYKDKDYLREGGWAAIGADPDFYSSDKCDMKDYHEGSIRNPKNEEINFTNTFRSIGLYTTVYILSDIYETSEEWKRVR